MKTILNRYDLYLFERLVSKLVKPSELPPTIAFCPCSDGLQIAAFCSGSGAVLTLTAPSTDNIDPFTLPWATVKDLGTKKPHYVNLDVSGKTVSLSWAESGIPQTRSVQSLGLTDKRLPPKPVRTASYSFQLFDAMLEAERYTTTDNKQYALDSICLRGANDQIIATDGRQAFVRENFDFPFNDDVLCPLSRIYGAKELRAVNDTIKIGAEGNFVYFNVGNVNIWLARVNGDFPSLERFTKDTNGYTWLNIDPTDAMFTTENLTTMPGADGKNDPVYVELDGNVSIRGIDTTKQTTTELRLLKSSFTGGNVTMGMNRAFLKNALELGANRIGFNPKGTTSIVGFVEGRQFIFMPLDGDAPEVDGYKLTVLTSNAKSSVPSSTAKPTKVERPIPTTVQACRNVKPQVKSNVKPKGKTLILDDAMRLRQNLRDTLVGVNALIQSIKSQRRQDKLLRDTVNSLRKLQNV